MSLTKGKRAKGSTRREPAKSFTLSVEFAGISLHVIHPQRDTVTVLTPTCVPILGKVSTKHEDGDTGARHVPYLLMDLANLDQEVKPGLVADGPEFQVVRRLTREEIVFEPEELEAGIMLDPDPLPLPDLTVYKGRIALKEGMLSDIRPDDHPDLNVRTVLKGGALTATTVGGSSGSNPGAAHGRDWDKFEADWAGSIKWKRTIPGDSLTIRIRNWDTGNETPLTLSPISRGTKRVIELKLANLCETNPLEWKEFEPRFDKDDVDFKWLFRLFEAEDGGSVLEALKRNKLPYPILKPRAARTTGSSGCTPGQFTGP